MNKEELVNEMIEGRTTILQEATSELHVKADKLTGLCI